jgi:ribosomal protein S18 acetylase RimI-like enzyme
MNRVSIIEADLDLEAHRQGIIRAVDAYARDEMGGGNPLSEQVKSNLIEGLRAHPAKLILLARIDHEIVGAAICFIGFSTFAAKPRINIHDLSVLPDYRNRGIGRKLLDAVSEQARARGCCSVTLEVRRDNARARHLYRSCGFTDWIAPLEFWEKRVEDGSRMEWPPTLKPPQQREDKTS